LSIPTYDIYAALVNDKFWQRQQDRKLIQIYNTVLRNSWLLTALQPIAAADHNDDDDGGHTTAI